jgi:vacuolar protein sorting-associated protein 3
MFNFKERSAVKLYQTIDYAGSVLSIRRDSFACVADSRSYALIDVDRQLKIPLFPISSLDDSQSGSIGGRVEDISGNTGASISRSAFSAQGGHSSSDDRGHNRSTSLGTFMSGGSRRHDSRGGSGDYSGRETPDVLFQEAPPALRGSPRPVPRDPSPSSDKPLPPAPSDGTSTEQPNTNPAPPPVYLKPHIVSPTPQEFLLVTGTIPQDPGVGIFVNLEGDVTRSTLQFDRYPDVLVTDGRGVGVDPTPANIEEEEEGFVLASMTLDFGEEQRHGVQIQRWDLDPGDGEIWKFWLEAPSDEKDKQKQRARIGLRYVVDSGDMFFEEVVDRLRLKRFSPFVTKSVDASSVTSSRSIDSRTATSLERVLAEKELFESGDSLPEGWEAKRSEEEKQFAERLAHTRSHVVAWSGKDIWWMARNPLALRLDASLSAVLHNEIHDGQIQLFIDRQKTIEIINSLRGREAKTETEFLSLGYIKQRAGLLLFMSILDAQASKPTEIEYRAAEEALQDGGLDPRVVLAIIPTLRNEIVEGRTGIWVHGGIKDSVDNPITYGIFGNPDSRDKCIPDHIIDFLWRYLSAWRKKKGFGSVANENEVFRSVDAALLLVLLQLDKSAPQDPRKRKALRGELYDLVDHGVDCFERAITLLESHHRLYLLSRLYQSRKMKGDVLSTWRRIVEGEVDEGGKFREGEQQVREYLGKIRDSALVQEYGVWLAARNPKLGIQVFADDKSHVKFEPAQVVEILREGAPGAVKDYLEYLVFNKNHVGYINDLIAYYLDIVTSKLEKSEETRATLIQTYESYRALRPPKPTYRQFITDNAVDEEWWHSRLRLLQLLGGRQTAASGYDVSAILDRITPYTQELVPEKIILDGRQSKHEDALRLLTHGLGDYDTAINYCLLGGSSIFYPISGTMAPEIIPAREEQAKLFGFLLAEFLRIDDIGNRVEQTSSLLERFGGWFDVGYVLGLIPDTWSVDLVSGFLVSALRRIVREKSETMIAKALSGAENLKVNAELIRTIDTIGPSIEA